MKLKQINENINFVRMTGKQKEMIVQDFEKYMRYTLQHNMPFTLERFATFATSLINFYQGSDLIPPIARKETALILSRSFNAGIGNRITRDDLEQIANLIISDSTIDYSVLNPIFE